MKCFVVEKDDNDQVVAGVQELDSGQLPGNDVLVEVEYSALNYKDALGAGGHPGVAQSFPFVPGIDAVGTILESRSPRVKVGERVIVGHENFGTRNWGGWCERVSVPAEWCIALPELLTPFQAMTLGTAGFTAAQCLTKILECRVDPADGPVVVSGATGGVGVMAVQLLSRQGFHVVAATGKLDRAAWLQEIGAADVINRSELDDRTPRPLLSAKWAAAVDTVGGNTLSSIIRSTKRGGVVTACGMVGGSELSLTVFPFILRGVDLQGIDSAGASVEQRQAIWNRLAGEWFIDDLEQLAELVPLEQVSAMVKKILDGKVAGRVVVRP